MNGIKITKEHFKSLPPEEQNLVIFEFLEMISERLKQRRKVDTAITAVTGFIGGCFAVAGKWFFLKS